MQKTIITTVGTSLITNYFEKIRIEKQPNPDLQDDYEKVKELSFFEHNPDEKKIAKTLERVANIKTKLNSFSNCAEISSIIAIEKELKKSLKGDETLDLTIHLLCTDTILSPLCAELIAKYLTKKGYTLNFEHVTENETIISKIKEQGFSSKYIIKDLRVDSKGNYEKGFMNLIENLDELKLTTNDILNITGGYKAIIPILTLYGQLKEIPLKYLYNDNELDKTNELVEIGNLPFNFDWEIAQNVLQYLKTDGNGYILTTNSDAIKFLEDNKFITSDKKTTGFSTLLESYMNNDENSSSKSVLGRFIEYKYYEYFNEFDIHLHKPSKLNFEYFINTKTNEVLNLNEIIIECNLDSNTKYSDLKRNLKKLNKGFQLEKINKHFRAFEEIDLGLSLKSNNDVNVICEVKPIGKFSEAIQQLGYGIMAFRKLKGYYPSELVFATYIVKFQFEQVIDWEQELNRNISNILKQNLPKNIPEMPFRVIASELNLTNFFKVNYGELFRNVLDAKYIYNNPPVPKQEN